MKQIKSALISVFYKEGVDILAKSLHQSGAIIYSTGGTQQFLESHGIPVVPVEQITDFPPILGGRVKTLHPSVFGGILYRRDNLQDLNEIAEHRIPSIDMVVVDLYPFEETVQKTNDNIEIIEKIDIGGVSLIRAAAKNFNDTVIVSDKNQYNKVSEWLKNQGQSLNLDQRRQLASEAFYNTSVYDNAIQNWFFNNKTQALRYGENPHQSATFNGNLDEVFNKIQGKELSYNNLLDIDAAVLLIKDFDPSDGSTFAIIKHNNACGIATRQSAKEAYETALSADPTSAFGGILICNTPINVSAAIELDKLFFEVLMAPEFDSDAIDILIRKKNRIILQTKNLSFPPKIKRSILNGELIQDRDSHIDHRSHFNFVTTNKPSDAEQTDLEFAAKLVKHTKSNAIVLVKDNTLLASGTGQTSRVDALKQAISKAKSAGFDLTGAVMASDAFFPFPDCVEIAGAEGISAIIQPGGSLKDQLSIDSCDKQGISMVFSGYRHFKH